MRAAVYARVSTIRQAQGIGVAGDHGVVVHVHQPGAGAISPVTWCTFPGRAGMPVPMSMTCWTPASPTRNRAARCKNARFANAPSRTSGAALGSRRTAFLENGQNNPL